MTTVITGASSGIGAALAKHYAHERKKLVLLARRKERLEELALTCNALGARTKIYAVDVSDFAALQNIAREIAREEKSIERVILNAGISIGHSLEITPFADFKRLYDVNLLSVHALLEPLLPKLLSQNEKAHLIFISSLASFITMPSSVAYGSSKRALNAYAEGMRYKYKKHLHVSVIMPGFIDTELTRKNDFAMPFFMDIETGVRHIVRAIEQKHYRYAFPLRFTLIIRTLLLLPQFLREKIIDYVNFSRRE